MKRQHYKGKKTAALGNSLLILLLGMALGALSKWSDSQMTLLAELTSGIQLWVLLGCVAALRSRTPWRAALHAVLLLGGMVCAYYLTAALTGGVWAERYLIGWGIAALLSCIPGYLVWFARGRSKRAWALSLGVLACQLLAMFALSGGVRLPDLLVIAVTAGVLLWDKAGEK